MQRSWEMLSATGLIKAHIVADSGATGVTISNTPDWLNINDIDNLVTILSQAKQWIINNEGVE